MANVVINRGRIMQRMTQLRDDIAANIARTGKRASGRTQASLRVVPEANGVALYGRPFFSALEYGSKPWSGATGVRMTFAAFRDIIRQWVSDKGLNFGQAKQHERTIGAITASIIRRGSRQYRTGNYTDVYDTLIAEAVKDIADIAGQGLIEEMDITINKWARMSVRTTI